MASIASPGIGSGLDINGLISKLMAAEAQPLSNFDRKEAGLQAKLSAYGMLKGAMSAFQTAVNGLASPSAFNTLSGSVADTTIASVSATSTAQAATYQLEVTDLATAQKLTSSALTPISDPTAAIGKGTLTISFGAWNAGTSNFDLNADKPAKSITIDDSNNSLNGLRDAINAADAGVTASILNDGTGYRLVLTSDDTGAKSSMNITVSEGGLPAGDLDTTGLSQFAYNADPAGTHNLDETVTAQSAVFKLDGIPMTSESNTVSSAIQGVTLTLLKETAAATTTTLTFARNTSGVKTAVNNFVKAFNDLAKTMTELGAYDPKTKKAGPLQGDASLRNVREQVRRLMSQQMSGLPSTAASSLSDIGVSFQRDGTLALNAAKLDTVLADSSQNVGMLFAAMGTASDSLVSYVGAGTTTKPGTYAVNVDQMATRGAATTGVAAGTFDLSGGTMTALTLQVDGTTVNVSLEAKNYGSFANLAAALQSKINGDSGLVALGKKVTVSVDASNNFTIASNLYGDDSSVSVTAGAGAANLFGGTGAVAGTTGVDVAGSIGGVAATGTGQLLTGAGDAVGMLLTIDGGIAGSRGTVTYTHGLAYQLKESIQGMLDSDGTLTSASAGIDRSIEAIDKQREALKLRLVDIEKRYRAQFTALDRSVAQMQQTSAYLSQQLASIAAQTSSD